jgi:hypothetical protein
VDRPQLQEFLGQDGPPLLFETMVFVAGIGELRVRYETWDEAAAGHRLIVDTIHRQLETAIDHADALLGHLT